MSEEEAFVKVEQKLAELEKLLDGIGLKLYWIEKKLEKIVENEVSNK